jgi:hypothetical protein
VICLIEQNYERDLRRFFFQMTTCYLLFGINLSSLKDCRKGWPLCIAQHESMSDDTLLALFHRSEKRVFWCCVHPRSIHPFTFCPVLAFLSTRRGPCRSEAPSTAWAAPGDHKPLIGWARWRSMGEMRLGQNVVWSFCEWTYRQGTKKRFRPFSQGWTITVTACFWRAFSKG